MLFLHVGLHKTGTTFLQNEVFPKWRGVKYIQWANLENFLRLESDASYLFSREGLSGQNWASHQKREASLKRLAELFPDARILISFRKHSGYIVSSYRQFLQRGGTLDFEKYFDIVADSGFMKQDDFRFRLKINAIEKYFHHRPFVFFHEEIHRQLGNLLSDIEGYIGGHAPAAADVPNRRYNRSVGYYPAQILRRLNKISRSELNPNGQYDLNKPILQRLRLTPKAICQHWLAFVPGGQFLSVQQRRNIDDLYRDDWDYIEEYAAQRSENAGLTV